jgi:eukaryotic-like serine/threonine-protein kinase
MPLQDTRTGVDLGRRLAPGTRLAARYTIERTLGIGGMGIVYKAKDEEIGTFVAVKVLRPELAENAEFVERFRSELVLARQVTHRNVVRIHDIGESEGLRFLTMGYVEGKSLGEVLTAGGPLPAERALPIVRQLAEALQAAHDAGIVHRDLKPGNVLLTEEDVAYVSDFGVARTLAGDGLTRAGAVVGTPDYLSPEQVAGDPVDARSDIYALGLVMYEMLTGQLPFRGESQAEMLAQRLTGRGRDVSQTGVHVPAPVRAIVRRCLERAPARRYQSGRELQEDVEAAAVGRGPGWRWPTRPWLVAAALLAAAAVVSVLWSRRERPAVATAPVAAVAVVPATALLPFVDETADPALSWTSTGVPEMLSAQLAEAPELRVLDPQRVVRTVRDLQLTPARTDDPATLTRLGDLLDAGRLVTGTVRRAGQTLRIDLRLTTLAGGATKTLSAEATGPDGLFAAVASLGGSLRRELGATTPSTTRPETSSLAAARDYQAGRARLAVADSLGAVPHLERAVAEDPGFAAAFERLSEAYQALGRQEDAQKAAQKAREAADPGETRLRLRIEGRIALLGGDPVAAEKSYHDLAQRFPNDVEALLDLAAAQSAQGHVEDAVGTLRQASTVDKGDPRAWFQLGKNMIMMGEARSAVGDPLVKALALQQQLRNEQGQADVENAMGVGHHQLGEYPQAAARYSAALEIRRRLGDDRGQAMSLKNRARVHVATGRHDAAAPDLAAARSLFTRLGDQAGLADIWNDEGVLHEGRGDYPRARTAYQEALKIRRNLGDERALAQSYDNLGYIFFLQGEYDSALVYWKQALERRQAIGDKSGIVLSTQNLGFLQTAKGQWKEATKSFLDALEGSREIDFKNAMAVSLGNLGVLHHLEGRYSEALSAFTEALTLFRELDDKRGQAEFLLKQASTLLDLNRTKEAETSLTQAEALVRETGSAEQAADAEMLRGEWHLLRGDRDQALKAAGHARELAEKTKSRTASLRAQAGEAALQAELGSGEPGRLAALLGEAEDVGDALLRIRVGESLARVLLSRRQAVAARDRVSRAVQVAEASGWRAGLFRLYGLQARILAAAGDPAGAARAQQAADRAAASLRDALPAKDRAEFEAHPAVREARGARSGG